MRKARMKTKTKRRAHSNLIKKTLRISLQIKKYLFSHNRHHTYHNHRLKSKFQPN